MERALTLAVRARAAPTAVGKSCLLLRFADDQFSTSFITTIGSVPDSLPRFRGPARAAVSRRRVGVTRVTRRTRLPPITPRSIDFKIKRSRSTAARR